MRKVIKAVIALLVIASISPTLFSCQNEAIHEKTNSSADRTGSPASSLKPGTTSVPSTENPPTFGDPTKGQPTTDAPTTEVPTVSGRGMTVLNLRTTRPSDIMGYLKNYHPDVVILSHLNAESLTSLTESAEGYRVIGSPSPDAPQDDLQLILCRSDRFDITKSATVWLSATPSKPSAWEGSEGLPSCSYALIYDRDYSQSVAVFSAATSDGGEESEREILSLYMKYSCYTSYFPTIVAGDLPTAGEDREQSGYQILTAGGGLTDRGDGLFTLSMGAEKLYSVTVGDRIEGSYGQFVYEETPYTIDLDKKLVALTFDDGPRVDSEGHAYTEEVLRAFGEHSQKGTFFVVGNRLLNSKQGDLVRQAFEAGHEIGNHTYDHTSYSKLGSGLFENLEKTDALVRKLTGGIPTTLLRAPGGSNKTSEALTLPLVNWRIDTRDWDIQSVTPEDVLATVQNKLREGDIVLMHDLKLNSPTILDELLGWMDENGFVSVTVRELFEFSDIQMDAGYAYYSTSSVKECP